MGKHTQETQQHTKGREQTLRTRTTRIQSTSTGQVTNRKAGTGKKTHNATHIQNTKQHEHQKTRTGRQSTTKQEQQRDINRKGKSKHQTRAEDQVHTETETRRTGKTTGE